MGHFSQIRFERARLPGKDKWRVIGKRRLSLGQFGRVLIMRQMPRFMLFPAFRLPGLDHVSNSFLIANSAGARLGAGLLYVKPRSSLRQHYITKNMIGSYRGHRFLLLLTDLSSPERSGQPELGSKRLSALMI